MTEKTYQVGGVAPWRQVRPGSLVRQGAGDYALRVGDQHHWVRLANAMQMDWARVGTCGGWLFDDGEEVDEGPVTIIALDVPADATAEHLRTLAEVFEVREAVSSLISADGPWLLDDAPPAIVLYLSRGQQLTVVELDAEGATTFHALDAAAKKLYRAGWRPGMTAEDAARLLAEQEATCRQ